MRHLHHRVHLQVCVQEESATGKTFSIDLIFKNPIGLKFRLVNLGYTSWDKKGKNSVHRFFLTEKLNSIDLAH